ncbi:hypothetical protein BJ742DRAFT_475070 [Cladochytrium replicatum]|nr:hypothetical protein BJ742DRAFT_475070 [Cladochytrium replicatum]
MDDNGDHLSAYVHQPRRAATAARRAIAVSESSTRVKKSTTPAHPTSTPRSSSRSTRLATPLSSSSPSTNQSSATSDSVSTKKIQAPQSRSAQCDTPASIARPTSRQIPAMPHSQDARPAKKETKESQLQDVRREIKLDESVLEQQSRPIATKEESPSLSGILTSPSPPRMSLPPPVSLSLGKENLEVPNSPARHKRLRTTSQSSGTLHASPSRDRSGSRGRTRSVGDVARDRMNNNADHDLRPSGILVSSRRGSLSDNTRSVNVNHKPSSTQTSLADSILSIEGTVPLSSIVEEFNIAPQTPPKLNSPAASPAARRRNFSSAHRPSLHLRNPDPGAPSSHLDTDDFIASPIYSTALVGNFFSLPNRDIAHHETLTLSVTPSRTSGADLSKQYRHSPMLGMEPEHPFLSSPPHPVHSAFPTFFSSPPRFRQSGAGHRGGDITMRFGNRAATEEGEVHDGLLDPTFAVHVESLPLIFDSGTGASSWVGGDNGNSNARSEDPLALERSLLLLDDDEEEKVDDSGPSEHLDEATANAEMMHEGMEIDDMMFGASEVEVHIPLTSGEYESESFYTVPGNAFTGERMSQDCAMNLNFVDGDIAGLLSASGSQPVTLVSLPELEEEELEPKGDVTADSAVATVESKEVTEVPTKPMVEEIKVEALIRKGHATPEPVTPVARERTLLVKKRDDTGEPKTPETAAADPSTSGLRRSARAAAAVKKGGRGRREETPVLEDRTNTRRGKAKEKEKAKISGGKKRKGRVDYEELAELEQAAAAKKGNDANDAVETPRKKQKKEKATPASSRITPAAPSSTPSAARGNSKITPAAAAAAAAAMEAAASGDGDEDDMAVGSGSLDNDESKVSQGGDFLSMSGAFGIGDPEGGQAAVAAAAAAAIAAAISTYGPESIEMYQHLAVAAAAAGLYADPTGALNPGLLAGMLNPAASPLPSAPAATANSGSDNAETGSAKKRRRGGGGGGKGVGADGKRRWVWVNYQQP